MNSVRNDKEVKFAALFYNDKSTDCVKSSTRVSMASSNENAEQSPSEKETNVDERFHVKMKSLMTELQLDGKTLLACAWTTIEESRRFKIAPWASTWDIVEGLNSEARPFLWV